MTAVDVSALADPVWALLDGLSGVNAFDGEFVDATGQPVDMSMTPYADDDGRVHAYAVYFPSSGWAHALLACGGTDSLDWSFQITCAGGDRTRALWCVSKVRGVLSGARVTVGGQGLLIREIGDPGPIRRDDKVSPTRFYLPLLFAVNA